MRRVAPLALLPAILLLGACAGTQVIKVIPVAGGKSEKIVLTDRGIKHAEDDDMVVILCAVLQNKESNKYAHSFVIGPKSKKKWTRVQVWEITQDPERQIIDNKAPEFNKGGFFSDSGGALTAEDPANAWVVHESVTTLVYRLRIDYADGSFSEQVEGAIVPHYYKATIRKDLGMK